MVADIAQFHRKALQQTRAVVAGIGRDQWQTTTPCDGWDVQALLNHLVSGNLWAAELGAGATIEQVGDRLDGDVLGDDALAAYDTSAEVAAAAFEAPGALDAPCRGVLRARARLGVRRPPIHRRSHPRMGPRRRHPPDTTLDPDLVDAAAQILHTEADMVRASGMFGEDLAVPVDRARKHACSHSSAAKVKCTHAECRCPTARISRQPDIVFLGAVTAITCRRDRRSCGIIRVGWVVRDVGLG